MNLFKVTNHVIFSDLKAYFNGVVALITLVTDALLY